ncbi:MAG TPA: glycosyltransferase family 4 protein [bacterium]|nr:glycosyltransferase family 4 protein [bacterium]
MIYNGLPVEKVINSRTAEEIRTELGISIDAKVIGNVSRLVEIKGIEDLIEAAALIASDVSNASFIVAGSPVYGDMKYVNKLKKVVSSKGLSDRFHFIGHREDIYDVINAFDIYVHTAASPESFGRTIVEAMLLNKVVVASNAGGPSEIVKEGETGFLFKPGDANRLADLLIGLLREPEKPQRMGQEGRRRALDLFTADRAVEEITRMLEEKKVQH